jgi:hypothetical protein
MEIDEYYIFTKHFFKATPDLKEKNIYDLWNFKLLQSEPENYLIILNFIKKHPWSIEYIDSGLRIVNKKHIFRKKLYLFYFLNEANTKYTNFYLPKKQNIFRLILLLAKCLLLVIFGILLLLFICIWNRKIIL